MKAILIAIKVFLYCTYVRKNWPRNVQGNCVCIEYYPQWVTCEINGWMVVCGWACDSSMHYTLHVTVLCIAHYMWQFYALHITCDSSICITHYMWQFYALHITCDSSMHYTLHFRSKENCRHKVIHKSEQLFPQVQGIQRVARHWPPLIPTV